MYGVYLINKPVSITSHDVVDYLRRITHEKTIGHAGTLDPMASGLMIVAIGREFTKRLAEFFGLDKEYLAEATLGAVSTTYDAEGIIKNATFRQDSGHKLKIGDEEPKLAEIERVLQGFGGEQEQMPPIFSAKKVGGQKAYQLARQGREAKLKPVLVDIYEIELMNYQYPILKFRTKVSSGTYIRSLVHDIGQALGTGAYLSALVRTKIGVYDLRQAMDLQGIKSKKDLALAKIF